MMHSTDLPPIYEAYTTKDGYTTDNWDWLPKREVGNGVKPYTIQIPELTADDIQEARNFGYLDKDARVLRATSTNPATGNLEIRYQVIHSVPDTRRSYTGQDSQVNTQLENTPKAFGNAVMADLENTAYVVGPSNIGKSEFLGVGTKHVAEVINNKFTIRGDGAIFINVSTYGQGELKESLADMIELQRRTITERTPVNILILDELQPDRIQEVEDAIAQLPDKWKSIRIVGGDRSNEAKVRNIIENHGGTTGEYTIIEFTKEAASANQVIGIVKKLNAHLREEAENPRVFAWRRLDNSDGDTSESPVEEVPEHLAVKLAIMLQPAKLSVLEYYDVLRHLAQNGLKIGGEKDESIVDPETGELLSTALDAVIAYTRKMYKVVGPNRIALPQTVTVDEVLEERRRKIYGMDV